MVAAAVAAFSFPLCRHGTAWSSASWVGGAVKLAAQRPGEHVGLDHSEATRMFSSEGGPTIKEQQMELLVRTCPVCAAGPQLPKQQQGFSAQVSVCPHLCVIMWLV